MEYHAIQTKSKTGCGDVDGLQRFSRMAYNVLMRLLCSLEVLEDCWWLVEEKWVGWVRSVCSLVSNKRSLVFTRNISALISQKKHENEDDDVAHMDGMHVAIGQSQHKNTTPKIQKRSSTYFIDSGRWKKIPQTILLGVPCSAFWQEDPNDDERQQEAFEHILEWTGMDSHGPQ